MVACLCGTRQGERGSDGRIKLSVCRDPFVVFGETPDDSFPRGFGRQAGGRLGEMEEEREGDGSLDGAIGYVGRG